MMPDPVSINEELVPVGSRLYFLFLMALLFARSMDFLSTYVATPNLVLEANPLAKKLGWKWGVFVNLIACGLFALWPLPAVVIITTSVLVAARNFQSAWLMRALGEMGYRLMVAEQIHRTNLQLYLFCLFAQAILIAGVGVVLILFSQWMLVPFGVGVGIITYALAITLYTLLSVWRIRRSMA